MTALANKAVEPLTTGELVSMHTGSLLSRLSKLQKLEFTNLDWTKEEVAAVGEAIAFKSDPRFETAVNDLKKILKTREHVRRGSKDKRKQRAWTQKHR